MAVSDIAIQEPIEQAVEALLEAHRGTALQYTPKDEKGNTGAAVNIPILKVFEDEDDDSPDDEDGVELPVITVAALEAEIRHPQHAIPNSKCTLVIKLWNSARDVTLAQHRTQFERISGIVHLVDDSVSPPSMVPLLNALGTAGITFEKWEVLRSERDVETEDEAIWSGWEIEVWAYPT